MRISGKYIDDVFKDVIDKVVKNGWRVESRIGGSTELLNTTIQLTGIGYSFLTNPRRKLSAWYACAELLWYSIGTKSADMLMAYAPKYKAYLNNEEAFGSYGHRFAYNHVGGDAAQVLEEVGGTQLFGVIDVLRNSPKSRQAVVSIWNANDLCHAIAKDVNDIPCTLTFQFMVRFGMLHMTVNMRSEDVWLGLPYDVFAFTSIQRIIAAALGVECGNYTHHVGSMHIYDKNMAACVEALNVKLPEYAPSIMYTRSNVQQLPRMREAIQLALELEHQARTENFIHNTKLQDLNELGFPMLADVVAVCSTKWCNTPGLIQSPALQMGVDYDNSRRD